MALWLAASWGCLLLLAAGLHFTPEALYFYALPLPFCLRAAILAFFEKNLPPRYGLHLLPAALAGAGFLVSPALFRFVLAACLTFEAFGILRQFAGLTAARGIELAAGGGRKIRWLRSFLLLTLLLVLEVLLHMFLPGAIPASILAGTLLLASSLCGWHFTADAAWEPLTTDTKYSSSSLEPPEKYRILTALEQQLVEKRYALDTAASLAGLAKKVQATPHQLSQVINETKGMSFFELIAWHRVQEAKKLLRNAEHRHLKIEEIGEQVGYLSKSSFNTVFKKYTGRTPSEFRDRDVRDHDFERRRDQNIRRHGAAGSTFGSLQTASVMISNFIKIYFRNQAKKKAFSFINIAGLVTGLASAILIWLYIQDELSYDRFHSRAEDIYRIAVMSSNPQTRTPHPMAQAMVREFPEVEAAVSLSPLYGPGLSKQSIYIRNPEKDVMFREPDGFAVDTTFFQVFDFKLVVGDAKDALKQTGGLILSQSLAAKYFGEENPLGKLLEIDTEGHTVVVTGILQDVPANSHFHPNFIISYVTMKALSPGNPWFEWQDFGHFNYVKLRPGANIAALENGLPAWMHREGHLSDENFAGFRSGEWRFALQPITSIHLHSHIRWELEANGNITYVYILAAAILFILIIATINFVNLSTARALERAKEAGIRRTLGASGQHISLQFLAENVFTCMLALVLAYGVVLAVFSSYLGLTGKSLPAAVLFQPSTLLPAAGLSLLIGAISGLFPALAVSSLKPGEILKGKFANSTKSSWLRKALVVVQFTVSAILIFGSVILVAQVKYMEEMPLGYDDEQVLVVDVKSDYVEDRLMALQTEIQKVPGVREIGIVSNIPGTQFNQHPIYPVGDPDRVVDASEIRVHYAADKPLDLKLHAGRWFNASNSLDSMGRSYILNQTAVKALGLTDPVGSRIVWDGHDHLEEGIVVGVVEDFHFQSLHVPIQPLLIQAHHEDFNYLLVKLEGSNPKAAMERIGEIYLSFEDRFGYDAFFLDQKNQQLYEAEKRALTIFNFFAGIALLLSAMGLLGLAYLVIVQRTKEIGIRKILGASTAGILWRENQAFLRLIAVALMLGLPVGQLIMNEWLAGFAYRVSPGAGPYLITLVISVAAAVGSVTIAILKTVLVNPARALRYE